MSSGASSRSRAPSRSQSRVQTEVEVALSEGDDEFLEIFVTEPEVVKPVKPSISPIRAPVQSPIVPPSPVLSLQSGQIPPPDVEDEEEPAETVAAVYDRTGEWVAGMMPPPAPPFPVDPPKLVF